jgi:LysM repeat protein
MQKQKISVTILALLLGNLLFAQSSEVVKKYIETYKAVAIEEEIRTGVPAAITLAQGIHETSAGTSDLVLSSNNHFGIKCKTEWTGPAVYHDDDAKGECFRKYNDPRESYKDHSDFLKNRPYYASLFKLDPTDYEGWAYGLKKAGYATNPKYPQILIKLIRDYNLQDYTLIALNQKQQNPDEPVWTSNNQSIKTEPSAGIKKVVVPAVKVDYPTGNFKINETNVVFVTKGTSFLKVADEHNISLSRLFDFNDMEATDVAANDQLVYLQRKRKTGANEFHTVAEGETMYDISQTEGIRLESLLQFNLLKPGMQPQVGEKLYLRTNAMLMPKLVLASAVETGTAGSMVQVASVSENDFVLHTVKPKETMYAISKKYLVPVEEVMKWNDLQSIDLRTGQQLKINKRNTNATN